MQDHVAPPNAPNPDGKVSTNPPFDFTRLGIRVPSIAISPWIKPGTIINNPTPVNANTSVYYEHSSIPKSLHALFAPNAAPLTAREVFAAPFHEALLDNDLTEPRTDCLKTLPTPKSHRVLSGLGPLDGQRPVSDLQRELAYLAAGVAGDDVTMLGAIDSLETEDAAARYVAGKVNKVMAGRQTIKVPPPPPANIQKRK